MLSLFIFRRWTKHCSRTFMWRWCHDITSTKLRMWPTHAGAERWKRKLPESAGAALGAPVCLPGLHVPEFIKRHCEATPLFLYNLTCKNTIFRIVFWTIARTTNPSDRVLLDLKPDVIQCFLGYFRSGRSRSTLNTTNSEKVLFLGNFISLIFTCNFYNS